MIVILPRQAALTSNQRGHWRKRAELSRVLRLKGRNAWLALQRPLMDRAHLTVTIAWHDARRRDVSNWAPTVKALVDGAVDAGALIDDDNAHLIGPDLRAEVDPTVPAGFIRLAFDWRPL